MNELELLIRLRDEVPLAGPSLAVEDTVLAAIGQPAMGAVRPGRVPGQRAGAARLAGVAQPTADGRRERLNRMRAAVAVTAAVAVAAAVAAGAAVFIGHAGSTEPARPRVIAWSGRPTAISAHPVRPRLGRARTEAQLVDYASRAAALAPGHAPGPHDWVFVKTESADSSAGGGGFLFGPPDKRVIGLQWIRVDWRAYASLRVHVPSSLPPGRLVHGQLQTSPGGGGTLGGWKSIRYSYLSSLPTDPARLAAVILADDKPGMPWYSTPDTVAIFNAISTLLQGETEGAWVPPRLAATMYRVLQRLPGVHFDAGTDLAGRTGIGLYMVIDGWYKQELVINPETYTFMGAKTVAIRAHTSVATDGTRYITKGQVLGWQALLESAIVRHPGQLP
jgi:hypothetical protein